MSKVSRSQMQFNSVPHRSWRWVTAALVVGLFAANVHAVEDFPYSATVIGPEAHARGGPSDDFYVTDLLKAGSTVEVYRHVDGGWCAIRPPAGSFSWVAAEHLEITDNPVLARVINVPVKTRVGSNFSEAHDIEYISLRQGEVVELLGSRLLSESAAANPVRWFKIAPPSGEFRWLHASHLAAKNEKRVDSVKPSLAIKTYPLPASVDSTGSDSKLQEVADVLALQSPPVDWDGERTDAPSDELEAFRELGSIQQVNHEADGSEAKMPSDDGKAEDSSRDLAPQQLNTHVNVVTWEAVATPTDPLASPEPRSFVEQYNALNVMLSRAILGDIESWKLEKLRQQTQMLVDAAATVEHQQLAASLAGKVTEFQSLQHRSSELVDSGKIAAGSVETIAEAPLPLPTFESDGRLGSAIASKVAAASSVVEMPRLVAARPRVVPSASELERKGGVDNSVFDASGVLVAVKSRNPGMPKYAITDSSGQIVKFLSTRDGSSLAGLVNREVGVLGQVGFIRKLSKGHVVAEKIVPIQR